MHAGANFVTTTLKNRWGKKRKSASRRLPSGRISSREPVEDVMAVVLAQPHRRDFIAVRDSKTGEIKDMRRDQKAEWLLGRLNLSGAFTELEYKAGEKYADIVQAYRAALDCRDSLANRSGGGSGREQSTAEFLRIREAYDGAFESMDTRAAKAVKRCIIPGEDLWSGGIEDARRGLQALVQHYGMTLDGKRQIRQRAR
jgi:hypothetical protein